MSLLPFFSIAQSPGGVGTANLKLWNKANGGVSTSGTNVTGWTDQAGVNMFAITGTPQYDAAKYNYNPAIVFDGSSRFTGNTSITNMTHAIVVGYMENSSGASNSGAMMGISTATNKYFFHTQGFPRHFTCSDGTANVDATLPSNTIQFSILSEDLGKTPAVNDMIRQNGAYLTNTGGDPAAFSGIPTLGARGTENIKSTSALAECILYDASLSTTDYNKVESYLAVKYGVTLSNAGGSVNGDYISSGGTTAWDASDNSGYHKQVIGIGRDNSSSLLQKQSHTSDDTTRIYVSSLQATNAANSGTISNNASFVMIGNNGGKMERDYATLSEFPSGQGIYRRIDREWKVTNTNFSDNFSLDLKLSTPYVTDIDIVLLVDDDGDFTNAQVFNPAVTYTGGVLTLSGITTTMIPANSTRYITIASINSRSPLPVVLVDFTAVVTNNKKVKLNWRTATEINSDYFAIERAGSDMQWQEIAQVKAAGNSIQLLSYSFTDNSPLQGAVSYRLRQVDLDGKFSYSGVRIVLLNATEWLTAYPQPAQERLTLEGSIGNVKELMIMDIAGRMVTDKVRLIINQGDRIVFDIAGLPPGVYLVKTTTGAAIKLIKK